MTKPTTTAKDMEWAVDEELILQYEADKLLNGSIFARAKLIAEIETQISNLLLEARIDELELLPRLFNTDYVDKRLKLLKAHSNRGDK